MMRNDQENFLDTTASAQLNRAEKRSFASPTCEIVQMPPSGPFALLPEMMNPLSVAKVRSLNWICPWIISKTFVQSVLPDPGALQILNSIRPCSGYASDEKCRSQEQSCLRVMYPPSQCFILHATAHLLVGLRPIPPPGFLTLCLTMLPLLLAHGFGHSNGSWGILFAFQWRRNENGPQAIPRPFRVACCIS